MSANESELKLSLDTPAVHLAILRVKYDDLQEKHTQLAPALQDMYTTLCTLARNVNALQDRVGHALAAVRGFPESIHVDEIPDGCPGWGMSEPTMPPCQQCPHESDCFEAGH